MNNYMQIFGSLTGFITANQVLLSILAIVLAFLIKTIVDYKSKANPMHDIWDDLKPGSDKLSGLVHSGVEAWAKTTGAKGTQKLATALKIIKEFTETWQKEGKVSAILKLQLWFFSMKAKDLVAIPNPSVSPADAPVTMDTPAVD